MTNMNCAHWIFEPAEYWHAYLHSSWIVMSFKVDSVYITASNDFAFLVANRMHNFFCDGWPHVKMTGIWMVVDVQ